MSEGKLTLTLHGYLPPSENALRCAHWSAKHREKRRALLALQQALEKEAGRELDADIKSLSESSVGGHWIGTIAEQRTFRTALSTLDCYLVMRGINLKDASDLKRFTQKRKKKQL